MSVNEKVVETKVCKHCNSSFEITDKDLEFYEKVSPSFPKSHLVTLNKGVARNEQGDFIKFQIPSPTLCPDCRQQRRLSFRNERKLYKRKCDATGKDIISIYSPDKPYKVYNQDYWWSDKWDAMDYGMDFDFGKSFFDQFEELLINVPSLCMSNKESINSDYCNISLNNDNCYLSFAVKDSQNIYHSFWITNCKNCIDCSLTENSEICYELLECNNCYNLKYSINCVDSSTGLFLVDCDNCNNCLFSIGLKNKSYFILNKKLQKEEFNKIKTKIQNDKALYNEMLEEFKNLLKKFPRKNLKNTNSVNCIGDFYNYSSNCINCFDIFNGENLKHSLSCKDLGKNCYDCCFFVNTENSLESSGIIGYKIAFSETCWNNNDIYYNNFCHNSSNLFGCIGLKNKSYCILNKQYTKEQYEELVPKIIEHMKKTGEWGEFFPSSISPFGYNETVANEYFPVSPHPDLLPSGEGVKGIIKNNQFIPLPLGEARGGQNIFNWSTYIQPFPKVDKIIPANMLPDNIVLIPDDILNRAIECEVTKKPFKIIRQELDFYRKHNLPIPKRHPDQRHLDRMALRNPRKLFDRKCDKCGVDIKTTYSPERSEVVYCENCYNKEIY